MDSDEAMDKTTKIDINEARAELANHDYTPICTTNTLMAIGNGIMIPEIIAEIDDDDMVLSHKIMEWMGY